MVQRMSGAEALAKAVLDGGAGVVTSYPGAPITSVVELISASQGAHLPRVYWMSNEKTAIETAYGASLGGIRALLCVKSVGLNLALDPLMVMNLAGCCAGFVILVGDDPGGWGSQNEQDSRWLAEVAELPLLEPCTVADAYLALRDAFSLSEQTRLPILVRITHALVQAVLEDSEKEFMRGFLPLQPGLDCMAERHVVLPVDVVALHSGLQEKMRFVRSIFERSPLNGEQGIGSVGVISAGFMHHKLMVSLHDQVPDELRLLHLGTVNPFPEERVRNFLHKVERALILEETAPIVERAVRCHVKNLAQAPQILGRLSGHVAAVGELAPSAISAAIAHILPDFAAPHVENHERPMPSREAFCEGCPYPPVLDALSALIAQHGNDEKALVVGDPGCMVRAQLPPYNLLDVKTSLGSSVATAAGIALQAEKSGERQTLYKLIALVGDSGFFHSGLQGLIDARRMGVSMLVVILDNGVTALSGGQPHPGTRKIRSERACAPIDLHTLIQHMGFERVSLVDLDRGENIQTALAEVWEQDGLSVVIARGDCVPAA